MKNGYDHHEHQYIYTYNLSVPKRFTLDVPNQSPPLIIERGLVSFPNSLGCDELGDRRAFTREIDILRQIVAKISLRVEKSAHYRCHQHVNLQTLHKFTG